MSRVILAAEVQKEIVLNNVIPENSVVIYKCKSGSVSFCMMMNNYDGINTGTHKWGFIPLGRGSRLKDQRYKCETFQGAIGQAIKAGREVYTFLSFTQAMQFMLNYKG